MFPWINLFGKHKRNLNFALSGKVDIEEITLLTSSQIRPYNPTRDIIFSMFFPQKMPNTEYFLA